MNGYTSSRSCLILPALPFGMDTVQIVVVGAGIAGLSTALSLSQKTNHKILVLENSPILTEAGAGIQCSAAASRMLCGWGLKEQFEAVATRPEIMDIKRYDNFEVLGNVPSNINNYSERLRGFPHWLVHRVDYQKILADAAIANGVEIRFAQKIVDIDLENVAVVLEDGSRLKADLIVGADGIHSRVRRSIPALSDIAPRRSGHFCYRALITREKMMQNPTVSNLIDIQSQQAWAGPHRHIISYPIAKGKLYNLVLTLPDQGQAPLGRYNEPGDLDEMREAFNDFHEISKALLNTVDSCAKWVIADLPPLPTWSSQNRRIVLVGDAAHAMVGYLYSWLLPASATGPNVEKCSKPLTYNQAPHAASGAMASLEDAEVLGLCLASCNSAEDLQSAIEDYEHLRKPRCERIQEMSRENGSTFSLPDGPAQQARDKALKAQMHALDKIFAEDTPLVVPEEDMTKSYPHPAAVQWLVGHDVVSETRNYLESRTRPSRGLNVVTT
jgi:salicylate hydroxylase